MDATMAAQSPLKIYPSFSTVADDEHVAQFAESLNASPDAVPPTYAAVYAVGDTIGAALKDQDLGIDFSRMLHGEQEFVWSSHPEIDERLAATASVVSDETRRSLRFITLRTEVIGADGREVCTSRTVLVVR
jgi:hypothetical protein